MSVPERNDLVTALRAVPGVADVELLQDDVPRSADDAGTLRIALDPGADEVSVATHVNQLLRQEFGLGVDSGRVELLEESEPRRRLSAVPDRRRTTTAELGVVTQGGRLLIQRMQLVSAAPGVSAAVTLAMGGAPVVGEADGAASTVSVQRSVAEATLRAVERAVDDRVRCHLERIETTTLGEDQVVLAVVALTTASGTERLIGVSAVREDARQAVIRATLDALNRRLDAELAVLAESR